MKNTIIGLVLGIIIALTAYYIYSKNPTSTNIFPLPSPVIPSPTPTTENTPSPSIALPSDETLIKEALAKKYKLNVDQISVIFKEINATQAAGTVSFSGEGGWFLAAKEGAVWKIVQDGNGTVSCEAISSYKFPVSMVPECVDKNGKLQQL